MRRVLLGVALLLGCGSGDLSPPRPDVVVIVVDTLRADRLPFYGGSPETAPFLDSLARQALVFDNAWATSSWTAPATASIFTGLYPNEHGVRLGLLAGLAEKRGRGGRGLDRLPEELETLPVFLKRLGYRSFGASATPVVGPALGFDRGFDRFAALPPGRTHDARKLADEVLAWRDEILASRPVFLYLHFFDPHGPFTRHEEWIAAGAEPPENPLDDIAAYDSEIRYADEQIRRIFEALGLGEDTLIVMTADHGQEFLDHGFRGHGWRLYSELTRVPLFLYHPGDPRFRGRVAAQVSSSDILPTLRALLAPADGEAGGSRSLLDAPRDGYSERKVFSMRTRGSGWRAQRLFSVVDGRYKLIVRDPPSAGPELYDLVEDPGEKTNLAGREPERVAELGRALAEQRARAGASAHRGAADFRPDPETVELLEELGYGEGGVNAGDAEE